jgi:hypothetical protein
MSILHEEHMRNREDRQYHPSLWLDWSKVRAFGFAHSVPYEALPKNDQTELDARLDEGLKHEQLLLKQQESDAQSDPMDVDQ